MPAKHKLAQQVFGPTRATRNLVDEPLTADDWRKVWEARKNFVAAIRQIVYEARKEAALKQSYDDLAASGGIVDAP